MLSVAAWIVWSFVLTNNSLLNNGLPKTRILSSSLLQNSIFENDAIEEAAQRPFRAILEDLNLPEAAILEKLVEVGLFQDSHQDAQALMFLALDFVNRPEAFSSILISDFGIPPLLAHQIRAAVMVQFKKKGNRNEETTESLLNFLPATVDGVLPVPDVHKEVDANNLHALVSNQLTAIEEGKISKETPTKEEMAKSKPRPSFKSVVVNRQAKLRRSQSSSGGEAADHEYGLDEKKFPGIASELREFYKFMTCPSINSQESPIREATASVYLRHSKLFLGYYAKAHNITKEEDNQFTMHRVFPTKEKESASDVLNFILWLRSSRKIAVSYEANLLRGLTKLLKFRFAQESTNDASYGEKSFDDIPLIREIRKLHREANKKQRLAPRSSDEKQKWLSWPEYLQVVSQMRTELGGMIEEYNQSVNPAEEDNVNTKPKDFSPLQRNIATLFQKYLILAIFASIPDRQRTIRELVVDGNFQKDYDRACWCIKHAPEDYKTGHAYGERPPLQLAETLTPEIDDFLQRWRYCLSPLSETLFVQPRTGKSMTPDSIYQIVSRCCYKYMGKRTNPHLLRDMLVTHVRASNASEKQLESLALMMGHSITMQRTSYDRRTLTQKVAPAVELMQTLNGKTQPGQ